MQLLGDAPHDIWRSYGALNIAKHFFVWKRYRIGPLWGDSDEASVSLISKLCVQIASIFSEWNRHSARMSSPGQCFCFQNVTTYFLDALQKRLL